VVLSKGIKVNERLTGTYRNIYTPLDISTMVLDLSSKAKTIKHFLDHKSTLNFLTVRTEGRLYIENVAKDDNINGYVLYNIKNSSIDYYINFKDNNNNFFYLKGSKSISLIGFSNSLLSLNGNIYKKLTHEKIADIHLSSESQGIKDFFNNIKLT